MPNNASSQVFRIEEDISSSDKMIIELTDTDMLYARPREMVGFESGGRIDIADDGIYNPGATRVVLPIMSTNKHRPLIIKGAFRDKIYQNAQKGKDSNHARFMRDQIEKMRLRANPLKIIWSGDQRLGVLWESKFGEEGPNDIAYELTFFIATSPVGSTQQNSSLTQPVASGEDLCRRLIAQEQAARTAMLLTTLPTTISTTIGSYFNAIDSALNVAYNYITAFENIAQSAPQAVLAQVNRVVSSCTSVVTAIKSLRGYTDSIRYDATFTKNVTVDAANSWWGASATTDTTMDQIVDSMRQIMLQAKATVKKATRLYRVQAGDTLESVAQQQLGARGRVGDLGIPSDQLVAGSYIRIPRS